MVKYINWPIYPSAAGLAYFLLLSLVTGCLGAPVEEEPPDVNLPPYISPEFLTPDREVLWVESAEPVELAVETLLDPNPEERLYYVFIGERTGLLEQSNVSAVPTDDLYRDAFYQFDRVAVDVDPCAERLRDHTDELIRLFVSDRPFDRVTEAEVEADDDGFIAAHRWLLRINEQICP